MEYLKIAQDLEMYGVSYFSITVSLFFPFIKRFLHLYTAWKKKANLSLTECSLHLGF